MHADVGYRRAVDVVQSDATRQAFAFTQKAIHVGGPGTVKVTTAAGDDVTFEFVVSGGVLPVQINRVWSTGTTVTEPIVALGD